MRMSIGVGLALVFSLALLPSRHGDEHPRQSGCDFVPVVATGGWKSAGGTRYELLLPPAYAEAETRSVDSAIYEWGTADGRRVDVDYGTWNRHFWGVVDDQRLIAFCNSGGNGVWPQIVLYQRNADGRFVAGLYWPVPGGRMIAQPEGRIRLEALWMSASSPDSSHLPELLAIVRSARLRPAPP